jgi:hypothetical protein
MNWENRCDDRRETFVTIDPRHPNDEADSNHNERIFDVLNYQLRLIVLVFLNG